MIGIYKFTSKITGLSYIGQSIHINTRYNQHLQEAKDDKRQTKWHQALKEQGIENFDFTVLEECDINELNEREIYWINKYNSFYNGYNSTPGGQNKIFNPQDIYDAWDEGLSPLEISKKLGIGTSCVYYNLIDYKNYNKHEAKIRGGKLAQKTAAANGKAINSNTTVYQYDLEGNFIKEWSSCKEVARNNPGWYGSHIGKAVNGKRKTAYGYLWRNYYVEKLEL